MVHTAVPVETTTTAEAGARIDGEREESGPVAVPAKAFECCLFLPLGSAERGDQVRAGRQVRRPTLLWEEGPPLSPEDELDITAPELTGPDPVRWRIDGFDQPFGRPGDEPRGYQAKLVKVTD